MVEEHLTIQFNYTKLNDEYRTWLQRITGKCIYKNHKMYSYFMQNFLSIKSTT